MSQTTVTPASQSCPQPAHPASDTPLTRLCAALDAAFEAGYEIGYDATRTCDDPSLRAGFARRIRDALAQAAAAPGLLTAAQREGATATYRRHLLAADPQGRYAIAALVWMPGQASPVHAHHTWCSYAVLDGTLTESVYAWNDAEGCAAELRQHPRATGAVSFTRAGHTGIHRLMNASNAPAVSIHLYGVAGEHIATHVNDLVTVAAIGVDVERAAEPAEDAGSTLATLAAA